MSFHTNLHSYANMKCKYGSDNSCFDGKITSKSISFLPLYLLLVEAKHFLLPLTHDMLGFTIECNTLDTQFLKSQTTDMNLLKSKDFAYKVTHSALGYHRILASIVKGKKEALVHLFNIHIAFG